MPHSTSPLPPEVATAASRGDKIEAIRLLREATGLGLREAKEAVEAGAIASASPAAIDSEAALPASVVAALHRKRDIEAIRLLREHRGIGLKDAKDAIDAYRREQRRQYPQLAPVDPSTWRNAIGLLALLLFAALITYLAWRAAA
jgi:ribosomal protein L7/L12